MEEIPEIKQNNLSNLIKISLALVGVILTFAIVLVAYTHFSGKCLTPGEKSKSTEFICSNKRKISLFLFGNKTNNDVTKPQVSQDSKSTQTVAETSNKNSIWSKFTKFFSSDKNNIDKTVEDKAVEDKVAERSSETKISNIDLADKTSVNQQKKLELDVDAKVTDDIKVAEDNNKDKNEKSPTWGERINSIKSKIVNLFKGKKEADVAKADSTTPSAPAPVTAATTATPAMAATPETPISSTAAITDSNVAQAEKDKKSDSWWRKITKYFTSKKNDADNKDGKSAAADTVNSKDISSGEKIAQLDTATTGVATSKTATDANKSLDSADSAKPAKSTAADAPLAATVDTPPIASSSAGKDAAVQPVSAPPSLIATTAQAAAVQPPPPPKYETPALIVSDNKMIITGPGPFRIKSIGYRAGQSFKKGDILVTFICKDIEQDIAIQKEVLKQKKSIFDNVQKLAKLNATSENSLVQAEADVEQVVKTIEKLEYQISNQCIVKADYSGKVISLTATEMQFVSIGQELMTINNSEALLIKAYIPVTWLEWLKVGSKFKFCYDATNCHEAALIRTGAEVDPASQTIDVFGKLITATAGDGKFVSGLSGQIEFSKP